MLHTLRDRFSSAAIQALDDLRSGNSLPTEESEFDFIVVGAGSAGCVLANRLASCFRVLLVEAGPASFGHPSQLGFPRARELQQSELDWQLCTEPEMHLDGRTIPWPRGRGVGGSSLINYMIYMRGSPEAYERWNRDLPGDHWSYENILPLFKKSERNMCFGDPFHGMHGEMQVENAPALASHSACFLEAAGRSGYKVDEEFDYNGGHRRNVAGLYQYTLRQGKRLSASAAFLAPLKNNPNLHLECDTLISRVVLNSRAEAIEYIDALGTRHLARAAKEIILCAGAVDTPKLLLLSGVGNTDALACHGIPCRASLPAVGQHLADHPVVQVVHRATMTTEGDLPSGGLFLQSGVIGDNPLDDIQLHPYGFSSRGRGMFCFGVTLIQPASRGSIELRSSDPLASPCIRANYLNRGEDLKALLWGVRQAMQLASTEPMQRILSRPIGGFQQDGSDESLSAAIRTSLGTLFHPSGSCRMGSTPASSVVDSTLRVHGISDLRIADASVMPAPIDGNTHATCVMIGEQAAQLLLAEHTS